MYKKVIVRSMEELNTIMKYWHELGLTWGDGDSLLDESHNELTMESGVGILGRVESGIRRYFDKDDALSVDEYISLNCGINISEFNF